MKGWAGASRSTMGGTECPILRVLCGAIIGRVNTDALDGFNSGESVPWLRSQQRVEQTWRRGVMRLVRGTSLGEVWTVSRTRSAKP